MIIVVDEAIPYWEEAFTRIAEVHPYPGRELRASDLRDADAIVVRSVTRVDASLLEGSSVQFVGSATVGMDHLDVEYLKARGIRFTNAAGCNATAVSEYVVASLMVVAERKSWTLRNKSIAIVGVGNVGSRVREKATILGMNVVLCDPPLREMTGIRDYLPSLEDVLGADLLTFHVPLTMDGPYPTWHMVDGKILERLSPRQFLINSARGGVIAGPELRRVLAEGRIEGAILDVWEDEPAIDLSLLKLLEVGTPHIAGYSINGKIRATEMILEELCRHFGLSDSWDVRPLYPAAVTIGSAAGTDGEDALRSIVLQAYDVLRDDGALRALRILPPSHAPAAFDRIRNEYSFRPEFGHFVVQLPKRQNGLAGIVRSLGFQVASSEGN